MKRNGKIEVLRLVACLLIVMCHIGLRTKLNAEPMFTLGPMKFTFFSYVGICVDFFFIVSGFLMAKSVFKLKSQNVSYEKRLGTETTVFIWKKLKALLPYSIFFSAIVVVILACSRISGENLLDKLISYAGGVLFLQRTGLTTTGSFISQGWYVSSMLIAMLVLYPIIRRFYNVFTHVIAPLLGMFCLGYLLFTYKTLQGVDQFSVITFRCNIRAIGSISLGTMCFEFCRFMTTKKFGWGMRTLMTVVEVLCYALAGLGVFALPNNSYSGIPVVLLVIAVTISFSQQTLLGKTKLFQNRFFGFLGAISLPIYLCQAIFIQFDAYYLNNLSRWFRVPFIFFGTIILGTLSYIAWTLIQKAWRNHKNKTKPAHAEGG